MSSNKRIDKQTLGRTKPKRFNEFLDGGIECSANIDLVRFTVRLLPLFPFPLPSTSNRGVSSEVFENLRPAQVIVDGSDGDSVARTADEFGSSSRVMVRLLYEDPLAIRPSRVVSQTYSTPVAAHAISPKPRTPTVTDV